ncbi:MAG: ABC transporter permease [Coriobacteriales bacterium]
MFVWRYVLLRLRARPLVALAEILTVALVSGATVVALALSSAVLEAQRLCARSLAEIGADLVAVPSPDLSEEGVWVDDLPQGVHRRPLSVFQHETEETSEAVHSVFVSFSVPIGLAGRFTREEVDAFAATPGAKRVAGALMASYCSNESTQAKVVLAAEEVVPDRFKLDPQEEVELEQRLHEDPEYAALAREQDRIGALPETEETMEQTWKIGELMGARAAELYHKWRPDVFGEEVVREAQSIEPPPAETREEEFEVLGQAPGSGYMKAEDITEGRYFTEEDAGRRVAVLREDFAKRRGLGVGSRLRLIDAEYEVIGLGTPSLAGNAPEVYVPLDALQEHLEAPVYNILFVTADSSADVGALRKSLEELFPGVVVSDGERLGQAIKPAMAGAAQVVGRFGTALAVLLALLGALAVAVIATGGVTRRAREVAVLRAIGWDLKRVSGYLCLESATNIAAGLVVGVAVGTLAISALAASAGQAVPYDPYAAANLFVFLAGGVPAPSSSLEVAVAPTLSAGAYAGAVAAALAITALVCVVVTRKARAVSPAEALSRP